MNLIETEKQMSIPEKRNSIIFLVKPMTSSLKLGSRVPGDRASVLLSKTIYRKEIFVGL